MSEPVPSSLFTEHSIPELGPRRRPGTLSAEDASLRAMEACQTARLSGDKASCLKALFLLWHDHLDEAHSLVQDLPGSDAAFVHGIMHRREPDFSNARYWFHRVASHPALELLADAAAPILAAHPALPFRLIRDGTWDPFAFIDAVSAASRGAGRGVEAELLRVLQQKESLALSRHLTGR